jgi:hypothetical protein
MHNRLWSLLTVSAVVGALLIGSGTAKARHYGSSVSNRHHDVVNTCDDLDFQFDDQKVSRAEEHFTVAKSAATLAVTAARNGGIEVIGWDGSNYSITACKAAAGDGLLKGISVSVAGNRVTASGPGDNDWTVYLIIKAPKGSDMSLEAFNGPIGLRDVSGKTKAGSVNGPISLSGVSGEINAHTQNGPISLSGSGGTLNLETQNGPITVALAGNQWGSGGVTARTENGPLDLQVPANYKSGVRVEMSGRSPVSCHASQCGGAQRTWDDENRYIEFGGSTPLIRMSTVNGPVSVNSGEGEL